MSRLGESLEMNAEICFWKIGTKYYFLDPEEVSHPSWMAGALDPNSTETSNTGAELLRLRRLWARHMETHSSFLMRKMWADKTEKGTSFLPTNEAYEFALNNGCVRGLVVNRKLLLTSGRKLTKQTVIDLTFDIAEHLHRDFDSFKTVTIDWNGGTAEVDLAESFFGDLTSLEYSSIQNALDWAEQKKSKKVCWEVSSYLARLPGWSQRSGYYLHNGRKIGHYWNVKSDGTLIDATFDQFDEDSEPLLILAPGDKRQKNYQAGPTTEAAIYEEATTGLEEDMKQILKGGKGDKLNPSEVDQDELARGIKVELEHTPDRALAKEIALDHLAEDPHYYTKLSKIHSEAIDRTRKNTTGKAALDKLAADKRVGKIVYEGPTEDGGYWAYLQPGFCNGAGGEHTVHERTVAKLLAAARRISPCDHDCECHNNAPYEVDEMINPVKRVLAMRSFKTPKPRKMRAVVGAVRATKREDVTFGSMLRSVTEGVSPKQALDEWGMRYVNNYVAQTSKVHAQKHADVVGFHKAEAWRNPDPNAKRHHRKSAEMAGHQSNHATRVAKMHGAKS